MSEASRRAAEAVHQRARRAAIDETRHSERGFLVSLSPLVVELAESSLRLKYLDDWRMSDQMRWWRRNYGLHVGDELHMVEMHDHEWLCVGMFSNRDVSLVADAVGNDEPWHYVGNAAGDITGTPDPISPSFVNGWGNSSGFGFAEARFMKQSNGFVVVEGDITGGLDNTVAFSLPFGYRPDRTLPYVTDLHPTGFSKIHVETNGAVRVYKTVAVGT